MRLTLQDFAPSFWPRTERRLNQFRRDSEQWLRRRADESVRCRECGGHVELFEEICPSCGVGNPVRISVGIGPVAGFVALACLAAAACLW